MSVHDVFPWLAGNVALRHARSVAVAIRDDDTARHIVADRADSDSLDTGVDEGGERDGEQLRDDEWYACRNEAGGGEHRRLALREVEYVGRVVDGGKSNRDEAVDAAHGEAGNQVLASSVIPGLPARGVRARPRDLLWGACVWPVFGVFDVVSVAQRWRIPVNRL